MNNCDPCAADPLSNTELKELGVFWLDKEQQTSRPTAKDVYVTRLHVRYDRETFPEDLMFQTTGDTSNFQGRYVIRHPWKGEAQCEAGDRYFATELPKRFAKEAKTLANLTNWDMSDIRKQQVIPAHKPFGKSKDSNDWIDNLWE